MKPTETQVCATCLRTQVARPERAVAHMPVREGKMAFRCHDGNHVTPTGKTISADCSYCHEQK